MANNRMPTGLVALSTTAITAIYMAGYLRTQAADATLDTAQAAPSVADTSVVATSSAVAAPTPTNAPTVSLRRGGQAPVTSRNAQPPTAARTPPTATPAAQAPQAQSQAAGYKDGTFSGYGASRRGEVWVDVTVQGGRITNVNITRSTLQYPLRDIASLPDEVVQRQSAQVDTVSRATYSSMAFRAAVSQALSQAVQA